MDFYSPTGLPRNLSARASDASRFSTKGGSGWRQAKARQETAQVLAFLQPDRAAVDFGDIADDGEAEAGAGLVGVEARAALEDRLALRRRDAGSIVLDQDLDPLVRDLLDGDEHPAMAVF